MFTEPWSELDLYNKEELQPLYLSYNSMTDTQILTDYKKCLAEAM